MSDPRRWLDDEGSPSDVRALLRTARGAGRSKAIPSASKARSAARLDRLVALPAAAGVLFWLKGVAIAAGLGAAGVVAVAGVPRLLESHRAPTAVPSASVTATTMPGAGPAPLRPPMPIASTASEPAPSASPSPPPSSAVATSAITPPMAPPSVAAPGSARSKIDPDVDPLEQEAASLDHARALLSTDPGAALAALDAHAVAFPAGHLGLERELLSVEALGRLGRVAEARARGEALLQRAHGSIYEDRVRSILDKLPSP
jgi:hypothetical protein